MNDYNRKYCKKFNKVNRVISFHLFTLFITLLLSLVIPYIMYTKAIFIFLFLNPITRYCKRLKGGGVVHHLADSHMYANVRFKLALTEEIPVILPIDDRKCGNYLITNCKLISHYCCSKTKEYRKVLNAIFFNVVYIFHLGYYNQDIYYENYVLFLPKQLWFFKLYFISLFLNPDYGYIREDRKSRWGVDFDESNFYSSSNCNCIYGI